MKKITIFAILLLLLALPVHADEPTEIHDAQELANMAAAPAAAYVLAEDIDMAGIEWKPFDFSGTLDGQGHSILNLTITQPGDVTGVTEDGNNKPYDTYFAGLFATIDHASIKNLNLVNVNGVVRSDAPIFVGSIAGCSMYSTISDCSVTARLELQAHDRMFGIGGVVGYGSGTVENTDADVTLVCIDTDIYTRDEQFLGGIYSTGFMSSIRNNLKIDGYISDHGYVHSGGITGMLMQYPLGADAISYNDLNTVSGKITFFEDNTDRRAYCDGVWGELLAHSYTSFDNNVNFLRDERFTYDTELRPEMCASPSCTETVVAPTCLEYGYTEYTCATCGYTYRDSYTLRQHVLTDWVETVPATTENLGLSTATCEVCGTEVTREEPMLESVPEPESAPEPADAPAPESPAEPEQKQEPAADEPADLQEAMDSNPNLLPLIVCAALLVLLVIIYVIKLIIKR